MHENMKMFEHGYPAGELKFMNFPASWNARMQRQLGCFVYDTFDYSRAGGDFEGFIDSFEEPPSPDGERHPTLIKYLVPPRGHIRRGGARAPQNGKARMIRRPDGTSSRGSVLRHEVARARKI
jgi:hypothetical protein